jgi:uncharacterized tellurite resistance protein B-like protein
MPGFHDNNGSDMGLKDWFSRVTGAVGEADQSTVAGPNLAVAALLVEVLRADYNVGPDERREVVRSVSAMLKLDAAAAEDLTAEAERHADQSHDLYQFTSQVNRTFSDEEKVALLEALWRVAQADAIVHKYEEHLIRRVADLIHVSHRGFIAAKLRAAGELPVAD